MVCPVEGLMAGVDEVGRGAGAAEVYAAAVILDPARPILGLADSKQLSAKAREHLCLEVQQKAVAWSVASASVAEIEQLNILGATLLAMQRAVEGLAVMPAKVLVDGNRLPRLQMPAEAIVKGDQKVSAISAASILAKVARDTKMLEYHTLYPHYGFDRHKGYLTAVHLEALMQHGPCAIHRTGYAPIQAALKHMASHAEVGLRLD